MTAITEWKNGIRFVKRVGGRKDAARTEGRKAPLTQKQKDARRFAKSKSEALENLAILDMETDPFDNSTQLRIQPFLAVLYSDNFQPVIIWEENLDAFIHKTISAIEALPDRYTIYAHNGGKFDFLFLISRIRGEVSFKGRGIMSAKVGNHELRDSFHIIPERLASYQKTAIDYDKMQRENRNAHRQEIIDYCIDDCRYLLDLVRGFIREFGFKISIGQAAITELKKVYKYEKLCDSSDAALRDYFFGGRVECLQGRALVQGHWKLFDVNSMYPAVMANAKHPIGRVYEFRPGLPGPETCFIDLTCRNNGALVTRVKDPLTGQIETTSLVEYGRFKTTIHEYNMAMKYGLISEIEIHYCVDCAKQTSFSNFVIPRYEARQKTKAELDRLKKAGMGESNEFQRVKMDDMFLKLLLNNAYGKFAQNPRRYKETYLTAPGERPAPEAGNYGPTPLKEMRHYWIWERPAEPEKMRFQNVGTAASITGAARAVLMEAIQLADDPIYCDTDSLICRDLTGVALDKVKLGAWDLEAEFSEVVICGKKLYSCAPLDGTKPKVRSKGVQGLSHDDMKNLFLGDVISRVNTGPTLTKTGSQHYLERRVRATAKRRNGNGHSLEMGRALRQA